MSENFLDYEEQITRLIKADPLRLNALYTIRQLQLSDWLIAAGFVRNMIWDELFGIKTAVNDIDVIYFCTEDKSEQRDKDLEQQLYKLDPSLPWSVKNQARMHIRNQDPAYLNSLNAMRHWPEKQTCIGVSLNNNDEITISHCFDLNIQFNSKIEHNPKRAHDIFKQRVQDKGWLQTWPNLSLD